MPGEVDCCPILFFRSLFWIWYLFGSLILLLFDRLVLSFACVTWLCWWRSIIRGAISVSVHFFLTRVRRRIPTNSSGSSTAVFLIFFCRRGSGMATAPPQPRTRRPLTFAISREFWGARIQAMRSNQQARKNAKLAAFVINLLRSSRSRSLRFFVRGVGMCERNLTSKESRTHTHAHAHAREEEALRYVSEGF